jgi:hypothetical protein
MLFPFSDDYRANWDKTKETAKKTALCLRPFLLEIFAAKAE